MILLTTEPIRLEAVHRYLSSPHAGGEVFCTGTVPEAAGPATWEFEAEPEAALGKLHDLAEAMRARFDLTKVALIHRIGEVELTGLYVLVGASAPRRDEALEACRYALDRLDSDVPVWRKIQV